MMVNLSIGPIVSLIAGVLILIVPRLLNYIVAIYLIVIGLIGIFGWGSTHLRPTSSADPDARASPSLVLLVGANRTEAYRGDAQLLRISSPPPISIAGPMH